MGTGASSGNDRPDILLDLGSRSIDANDQYWQRLLNTEIPETCNLQNFVSDLFAQNQSNFILAVQICTEQLCRLLNEINSETNKLSLKTTCIMLRNILPVIVSNNLHIKMFNTVLSTGDKMGKTLVHNLSKSLHLRGISIVSEFWYEKGDAGLYDSFRSIIIETLLLLKQIGVNFTGFESTQLVTSLASATHFYLNSQNRKSMKGLRKLLVPSYMLMLSCNIAITDADPVVLFRNIINGNEGFFSKEEHETIVLPLVLNILKLTGKEEPIIDSASLSLVVNTMHCVDLLREKNRGAVSLFTLASVVSFPSLCLALNAPCPSFYSEIPVHRGTYADILLEIVSRSTTRYLKTCALIVSAVIPYASQLSYSSAVLVFKMLEAAISVEDLQSLRLLIAAIHYLVNRSICENVPLVIVLLKNSKLLAKAAKVVPDVEECEQLVALTKNVNQELKQLGKRLHAAELEKFFSDPSAEQFALPVLRPPAIDFEFEKSMQQHVTNLSAYYLLSELGMTPKQSH